MNIPIILALFFLMFCIFISVLVIRKSTRYKTYLKKKEANKISKNIVYSFTKEENYNLSDMISYHEKNRSPKYEI